jgi:threonine dehydratase
VLQLADVMQARNRIGLIATATPLIHSPHLSSRAGCEVLLKLETLQPTGAFKIRGAANAIAALAPAQRSLGVICCSTGNHGRAVAYAARHFGIPATVCLSKLVPANKVAAIEDLKARVIRKGANQDEAQRHAERIAAEQGLIEIPPFDHEAVVAGQGTIALEILEQRPDIATIVVPLSGGGLIGGIALAAKTINPRIKIIGVSMDRGAAMHESLRAGRPVEVAEVPSLADSLGGGIGLDNRVTFELCRSFLDDTLLIDETEIYRGMRALFLADRIVAEGGGAVGAAALLAGKIRKPGPMAVIISGQNVDMRHFLCVAGGKPIDLGDVLVKGD